MKKKLLSWLLLFCLVTVSLPAFATTLSMTTEETLIKGVTYRHIEKLAENGWQDIFVVTADLNEPHLQFDVLSHASGKSHLENTYASAVNHDAIAAINADFFQSAGSGRGTAIGLEMTDGVIRTSPAAYEKMNAMYQLTDSTQLHFNMFSFSFSVTAPDETNAPISVINKYDSMTGIVLYTPDWGETTPGSSGNVMEMVVEDGVVTAKNRNVGAVSIPKEGYVLACDLSMNTFLDDHFQVGDAVILNIATTPNHEAIQTAVGGGGMLLVEGQIPDSYSHTISGTHPRSAVGVDKTGTILTLVAVDGRRSGAAGMTMKQLGALMAELGCYNAMNLDGGGSTLMAVKKDGTHQVVNQPSDGSFRAVTNSIGIMADTSGRRVATSLRIKADDKAVFSGISIWLQPELLDQYGLVMETPDEVQWKVVSGSGTVENNSFRPTAPGKAVLRAESGGLSDEITLTVLDVPHTLTFSAATQQMKSGESRILWLTGRDAEGRAATVYPKDLVMTVQNPAVASISGNSLTALAYGSTVVTAEFGGVTAYLSVAVDGAEAVDAPDNEALPDPRQKSAGITAENGFQFTVFGNTRTPVKFFDLFIMNGVTNAVSKAADMNFFVGNGVDASLLEPLGNQLRTANGFSKTTRNGSTFITLKNAYGTTLYGADKAQWEQLRAAVENLSGGNLFVFLNDHNISSLATEIKVFKNLMAEAATKADNVYVFAGGYVNETVIEDGVRYITTAGVFPSIGIKPPASNISYVKYYLVTVNGNQVTYETKGIV